MLPTRHRHISVPLLLLLQYWPDVSWQGVTERRLLKNLFQDGRYNKLERPVYNESEPLVVDFNLTLQHIIDVDEKNQILISNIYLKYIWYDYGLIWNESDYGGIKSIRVPPNIIWKPDIYMYNSADKDMDSTFPTNVVVSSDGQCFWAPPGLFFSTCKIDIKWFPFDGQECPLTFGSWTYDNTSIDLQLNGTEGDTSNFHPNGEWKLLRVPAVRNVRPYNYSSSEEQHYVNVTFLVVIQRRKLYYVFNLVVPCLMMSCLSLLVFSMPPDAGEKITCGVTILLSLTVFLQLVAETMPPTSDAVPLIGMYFASIMMMCSLSMVFTVLVLHYHHRTPDTHSMPQWVQKFICGWLASIVRVQRSTAPLPTPDPSRSPNHSRSPVPCRTPDPSRRLTQLTSRLLQERSPSLLANVLDLEDDFLLIKYLSGVKVNPRSTQGQPKGNSRSSEGQMRVNVTSRRWRGTEEGIEDKEENQREIRCGMSDVGKVMKVWEKRNVRVTQPCNRKIPKGDVMLNLYADDDDVSPSAAGAWSAKPGHSARSAACSTKLSTTSTAAPRCLRCTYAPSRAACDVISAYDVTSRASRDVTGSASRDVIAPRSQQRKASSETGLLGDILDEVQYLTGRLQKEAETQQVCNDWKFAAMVIDRVCLWLFSVSTVISTGAILFSAPHSIF